MKKTLLIYLDSSDISRLSNPNQRTPELDMVEKKLFEWLEEETIEFRFSMVHVLEAAPIRPEHIEQAAQRFRFLKRLCGQKCFIDPISIFKLEVLKLANQATFYESDYLKDNGEWFDVIDDGLEDLRNHILKIPDRKERREVLRKTFTNEGLLRAEAKLRLKAIWPDFKKDILSKYPVTDSELEIHKESYCTTGSMSSLILAIKSTLYDLDKVATWYELHWDSFSSNFLRESGESFKNITLTNKNKLEQGENRLLSLGVSDIEITNSRRDIFEYVCSAVPIDLAKKIASHLGVSILENEINWESLPSLLTHANLAIQNAKQVMTTQLKAKPSDYGDYSHVAYLPHVDIYRTDAAAAAVIKQLDLPFKTIVVAKLSELPSAIEKQLQY